jgi:hypothetical protein
METIPRDGVLQCQHYGVLFQIDSYFSRWQNFPPLRGSLSFYRHFLIVNQYAEGSNVTADR